MVFDDGHRGPSLCDDLVQWTPMSTLTFADLATLVRSRRTAMIVDQERAVSSECVAQLCELAQWAPNHKRTWPWRFAEVTGEGRLKLGEAFVADMVAANFGDEGKRLKTRTKYARTPTVLVVGCAPGSEKLAADDRDAVAAAIQTLLLGATAHGLASFWSTAPITVAETVNALCAFPEGTRCVGVVYLGWPTVTTEAPERPPVAISTVS
jgi:nitroreductase